MNGLEKITGRIQSDAQAQARDILAQARAQAEDVARDYRQRAQEASQAIAAQGELQAKQRAQRLASAAELEGRKLLLAEKRKVVDEAFDLALTQLKAMDRAQYTALLTRLLTQAAPTGRGAVIFNAADRAQLGQTVVDAANQALGKGQLTLSPDTRDVAGGFLLADGPVELNCSLETLLSEAREARYGEICALLFPEPGKEG